MTQKSKSQPKVVQPPDCPSLDPRRNPHPAYTFGASFINDQGEHQVLAFKDHRVRMMLLGALKATAIQFLDLPGGVYQIPDSERN